MDKEIKSLTGIRGIAALWVVLLHYRHAIDHNKESFVIKFITNGFVSVDIFFLLSAFVMCLAYSEEFKRVIAFPSYSIFIKKRFARIYPAYFVWILMFLSFEFIKLDFDYSKIVVNLLLIQNIFNNVEVSFIFWSLSSEWILYLIFPFMYFILQKKVSSYIRISLMGACIVGIYVLPSINNYIYDFHKGFLILPKGDITVILGVNSILRCFFSYVIGINLFLIIKDFNIDYIWGQALKYCAIIGILIVSYFGKSGETYVMILMCSILLISALYFNREKLDSFFACKVVYFMGIISYSMYLCHMFVLVLVSILVKKLFPMLYNNNIQVVLVLCAFALLIPISYISYKFIELKGGHWLKSKLFVNPNVKRS